MADNSHIEWTDATWNIITGCSVVSAGCKHCYAMKLAGTRLKHDPSRAGLTLDTAAGPVWNGQVRFNEKWLDQPLRWSRARKVFVCAHGDLFHENVPFEWIDRVFEVMARCNWHTFQVLTKRPERALAYFMRVALTGAVSEGLYAAARGRWPLPNVWLGVSVENQAAAEARIPLLLQCPAAVRWISAEPLLGRVDLTPWLWGRANPCTDCPQDADCACGYERRNTLAGEHAIDWVVVGGESGAGARPMHPDWATCLYDQCLHARVPFLFKQWGDWEPATAERGHHGSVMPDTGERYTWVGRDGTTHNPSAKGVPDAFAMARVGKKQAGRVLGGTTHDGYPETRA